MIIYLIRHGESILNAREEGYELLPDHALPLTEKGKNDAELAGKALLNEFRYKGYNKSELRMWVSPYKRARQTAEIINKHIGLAENQIREDDMLTEIQFGLFDGLSDEERDRLYPVEVAKYKKDRLEKGKFYARRPGGESPLDVEMRLRIFFDTIYRDFNSGGPDKLIIVCHGALMNIFLKAYFHKSHEWYYEQGNPKNGSIIKIENRNFKYIHGAPEEK